MVSLLHENIWELSSKIGEPGAYTALQSFTRELIAIYEREGRLEENPFLSTTKRKLSLPLPELEQMLNSATCLVTGGLGCVGSNLVKRLLSINIRNLIIVDSKSDYQKASGLDPRVTVINADICDAKLLEDIFERVNPHFVFHIGAQRNPGYAELHALETLSANVLGSWNVLNACENSKSVRHCVFSSTGKASRYYTSEVYAATKKVCEYLFEAYARKSSKYYSMVRFTHILENSLMNQELQNVSQVNYLGIHSPGKYVTAQNVTEAADLMLNAVVYAQAGQCNFLTVRNLEWPVESLEVALYYIKKFKSSIPVVYRGNPAGYCEKFFRGQMDWSNPLELNLLINVYESRNKSTNNESDIIISQICPADDAVIERALPRLKLAYDDSSARALLLEELKNMVRSSLLNVDKRDTVKILQWGLQPNFLKADGSTASQYEELVSLLFHSLGDTTFADQVKDMIGTIVFNPLETSYNPVYGARQQINY